MSLPDKCYPEAGTKNNRGYAAAPFESLRRGRLGELNGRLGRRPVCGFPFDMPPPGNYCRRGRTSKGRGVFLDDIIRIIKSVIEEAGRPVSPSRPARPQAPPGTSRVSQPQPGYQPGPRKATRPSAQPPRTKIIFKPVGETAAAGPATDLAGLVDAFTGAALDPARGLLQCQGCQVFYHRDSYQILRSENGGRCVACLGTTIQPFQVTAAPPRGRNAEVSVVTLQNYRQFTGRVITFEGRVRKVLRSRRGTDYAVMFEDKSWKEGFKLVVFMGKVDAIGGTFFLRSLIGKTIRVRGLLVQHEKFGYEIIVSERGMILSIT